MKVCQSTLCCHKHFSANHYPIMLGDLDDKC